jgi:hypothetical protein
MKLGSSPDETCADSYTNSSVFGCELAAAGADENQLAFLAN